MSRWLRGWGVVWMVAGCWLLPALVWAGPDLIKPVGYVADTAGLLTATERQDLETLLSAYQQRSGNELAVATIDSLAGEPIEDYAARLFQAWGIGKKGQDNGVLLLVAKTDQQLRIEVGYGLEPLLTDAASHQIIDQVIVPRFKAGDYYGGIGAGVTTIIDTLSGQSPALTDGQNVSTASRSAVSSVPWTFWFFLLVFFSSILGRSKSWWGGGLVGGLVGLALCWWAAFSWLWLPGLIVLGLLFDFLVSRISQRRGPGGPWWGGGRGGFGGGFGGFGGGMSGGGGASGRW